MVVTTTPKKNDPADRRCALAGQRIAGRKVECEPLGSGDTDWCHGCGHYICKAHEAGTGVFGSHMPTAHLEP